MKTEKLNPELSSKIHSWINDESLSGKWIESGFDCGPAKICPSFVVSCRRFHSTEFGPGIWIFLWLEKKGKVISEDNGVLIKELDIREKAANIRFYMRDYQSIYPLPPTYSLADLH